MAEKEEIKDETKTESQIETPNIGAEEFEDYNGFKVQKGAKDIINKRVASETHTLKEKLKTISEENNTFRTQFEEFKLSQMSEKEKQAHEEQKRKEKEESLVKKADEYSSKYKNYFLDTELFKEVSNFDVVNSKQVLALIKAEYKTEFAETEDGVNIFFNNGSTKLTVQEAVKNFLNDPSNANLIKSKLITGSGTKTSNTQPKQNLRTVFKASEIADIKSESAREYREAMKAGLNPTLID